MSDSAFFYGMFVDPVLTRMRKRVGHYIEPGQHVLDVACGTGSQLLETAGKAGKAVGFDASESMVQHARKAGKKSELFHIDFLVHDATQVWPFADNQFDVAILSLALHQFPPESYAVILHEMQRVSAKQLFVDYAIPLPRNVWGAGSRLAEFFAGREHFRNFRKFKQRGGLPLILPKYMLKLQKEEFFANNVFHLVVCS